MSAQNSSVKGRLRWTVAIAMAVASALFFLEVLREDIATVDSELSQLPWALIIRYAVSMAAGGAIVGALLSGWFGRGGIGGWLLAILGGLIAAAFAGVVGSFVGFLPDIIAGGFDIGSAIAIFAGLIILPLAFLGWPLLIPIWAAIVCAAHIWAKRIRASAS
ncbi:MAG: hypothetical protein AAGI10_02710 [Pseudomonadota bacterium]